MHREVDLEADLLEVVQAVQQILVPEAIPHAQGAIPQKEAAAEKVKQNHENLDLGKFFVATYGLIY